MKLKEFATINMGQSPKGETYNTDGKGMPFLQGRKTFGRIYPTIDTWTTNPIKTANKDEILMSVRAPVGDMNFANQEICIGRGLCSINAKNARNKYLYYMLLNSMNDLKQKSTGTVFDSINRNDLENLEINFHCEEEQEKIENILGSIDNKIELNNEINNNLYKFLNKQYEHNFINFTDENMFHKIKLKELISIRGGFAYKASCLSTSENDNILISMGNVELNNIFNFNNLKYYSDKVDEKYIANVGDMFICTRDVTQMRNQLGCPGIIPKIFKNRTVIIGTNLYIVDMLKGNTNLIYYLFLLLNSKPYREKISNSASGTAILMIKKDDILEYEFAFPNDIKFVERFIDDIKPIFDKIENNLIQNKELSKLRDTLLPKLMNGEIDLDNIEI